MIGCQIRTAFHRADASLVEAFRGIAVANIDDCMNRTAAAHQDIRPMNAAPLLGTAFTVKLPAGDNLMFHKAMDLAQPGDVVVIDAGGYTGRAIFGEIMAAYCRRRGLAGIAVDGAIRDWEAVSRMDFPVYARGVSPNGPYKNGPGEIGGTISFGGITVYPGDIIVGDGDGILAIRPGQAEAVLKAVHDVEHKESEWLHNIESRCEYSRPWVDDKLKEIGCQFVD